jgi:DNA-binding CsgD family transcriptional regulator
MTKIDDFFIPSNTVLNIPEEEYRKTAVLIDSFNAVSRAIYQSLYIIDYYKKNFLHVLNNPLFLCGNTAQEVQKMGFMFYLQYVPEKEQKMLIEINAAGFDFFEKLPANEKIKCTISCDFHLVNGRKKTLVNHKLTPILLDKEGRIWLAACIVSLSSHSTSGNVMACIIDRPVFWEYSLKNHSWEEKERIILNEREKEILSFSSQGYTMGEIADKLCVALDTVKFYKKRIFEKMQVKNITEALSFAVNHKLL